MKLTKRDIGYTIISRFEETFREFLHDRLLEKYGLDWHKNVPKGIIDKVRQKDPENERLLEEAQSQPMVLLTESDFFGLCEIVLYNENFSRLLSSPAININEFSQCMNTLKGLRDKIAHSKPFGTVELDSLVDNTTTVTALFDNRKIEFLEFQNKVLTDPEQYAQGVPSGFLLPDYGPAPTYLHNLPYPDYYADGGFVGRKRDLENVRKLILGPLHRVITICGAGGVGKTALALEGIYSLLESQPRTFDGVVWFSAKEKELTVTGIEEIPGGYKDYEDLLDIILTTIGFTDSTSEPFSRKELDVKMLLSNFRILLIIDNLETIADPRIFEFIKECPPPSKVLITSRTGLAEVERRFQLKELPVEEAIQLMRVLAREKKLESFLKLPEDVLRSYAVKLACYPLVIKWVIGQVAVGRDINEVVKAIETCQTDITKFCFENVYSGLDENSKRILMTLSTFEKPLQRGILEYISGVKDETFVDAINQLIIASLVVPEHTPTDDGLVTTKYSLVSLTKSFAKNQLDREPLFKKEVFTKLQSIEYQLEQAERAKVQYKYSLVNLGAVTEEEKIAAVIAQAAFAKYYQVGQYESCVEDFKRAIAIAPKMAALYRNFAVIQSNEGHHDEADKLMAKAVELNPNDVMIWLTWGNMKRKLNRTIEAEKYLKHALELEPNNPVVLNSLAWVKCYLGYYEDADRLFSEAIKHPVGYSSQRHQIINYQGIAENLRRWAEALVEEHSYDSAIQKLKKALEICKIALELNAFDERLLGVKQKVCIDLGIQIARRINTSEARPYFDCAIVDQPRKFKLLKGNARACLYLSKELLWRKDFEGAITEAVRGLRYLPQERPGQNYRSDLQKALLEISSLEIGKITKYNKARGFGFITPEQNPEHTIYFHIANLKNRNEQIRVGIGVKVAYHKRKTNKGIEAFEIHIA